MLKNKNYTHSTLFEVLGHRRICNIYEELAKRRAKRENRDWRDVLIEDCKRRGIPLNYLTYSLKNKIK